MKLFVPLLSWVLVSQNKVVAQSGAPCSICGEGLEVTIPDGVVTIPQNGDFSCSELEAFGQQGGFDASVCTLLEPIVASPCGCAEESDNLISGNGTSVNGTFVPTASPTIAPTFGPAPDCFDDLDAVQQRERALSTEDIQVGRTYTLCPDTVFFMGTVDQTGQFQNGFAPITPRPNVLYKCGESGSSANGCRLLGGSFAIVSYGDDTEQTNVTFQGLTIESSQQSGVLAANAGDYTFIDCIFKNHESFFGPVDILFNTQSARRLYKYQPREMLHGEVHAYSESYFANFLANTREGDRHLQGSTGLTTLTMTFKQTIFEGNKLFAGANSGMVTSVTPETILNFEDVIFQNNDYGDPTLQIPGAAILSMGPLTLKNSCFLDNSFVLDGAVIYVGTDGLDVSNNYISPVNDKTTCSFIASYPDESAFMAATDLICTNADATSCAADIPPVSAPTLSPDDQPTRIPVPRLTLPPASSPTSPPSSARMSMSLPQICVTIIVACGLVFLQ